MTSTVYRSEKLPKTFHLFGISRFSYAVSILDVTLRTLCVPKEYPVFAKYKRIHAVDLFEQGGRWGLFLSRWLHILAFLTLPLSPTRSFAGVLLELPQSLTASRNLLVRDINQNLSKHPRQPVPININSSALASVCVFVLVAKMPGKYFWPLAPGTRRESF